MRTAMLCAILLAGCQSMPETREYPLNARVIPMRSGAVMLCIDNRDERMCAPVQFLAAPRVCVETDERVDCEADSLAF